MRARGISSARRAVDVRAWYGGGREGMGMGMGMGMVTAIIVVTALKSIQVYMSWLGKHSSTEQSACPLWHGIVFINALNR